MLLMKEEKITRKVYQWQPSGKRWKAIKEIDGMDCVEEDLRRASVTKF